MALNKRNAEEDWIEVKAAHTFKSSPNGLWFNLDDDEYHVGTKVHRTEGNKLYVHRWVALKNVTRWNVTWDTKYSVTRGPLDAEPSISDRLSAIANELAEIAHKLK